MRDPSEARGEGGPRHDRVVVLGCGYTGEAIARRAHAQGRAVVVTSRRAERREELRARGFTVETTPTDATAAADLCRGAFAVVAFPPDGATDRAVAPGLGVAAAVTYLSTTGVYPLDSGLVDDDTPVMEHPPQRVAARLAAEDAYRAVGATVLRAPGIYGADRGLHVRVVSGAHRVPGDGTRFLSRIHVDDLAAFVLASERARGQTFVVGDSEPAPHIDVVRWICHEYGVPEPPSVPIESVHETLRGNRRVDASRAARALGVTLRYPSYRDGMRREQGVSRPE
ncbi:MAG: NAD(P)-binding domain-containing protein [Myxococcales bacterium]|nr:NAD(P)-binding domain-containing protein [Myxococcales bacterium]